MQTASAADDSWHGPRSRGDPALLDVLAELLRVSASRITVTSGVRAAAVALAQPCHRVIVERPTFSQIPALFRALGLHVRTATWPELADPPRVEPGTAIWVTSPARNPDGASLNRVLAARIHDVALAQGGMFVINEAYRWYASHAPPSGCTRVGTFSKLVGGGVRLGWVVDPPDEAGPALARLGPATAWQRAWASFMRRTGPTRLIDEFVRPVIAAREAFLTAAGPAAARLTSGTGPSTLLPLSNSVSEQEAVAIFAAEGILAGAGRDFLATRPSLMLAFTGLTSEQARAAGRRFRILLADNPGLPADPPSGALAGDTADLDAPDPGWAAGQVPG
jgi:DNA-binding transcriptional MocR family regulator